MCVISISKQYLKTLTGTMQYINYIIRLLNPNTIVKLHESEFEYNCICTYIYYQLYIALAYLKQNCNSKLSRTVIPNILNNFNLNI